MKIVTISDTHKEILNLPSGDVLIHSGDYSFLNKNAPIDSKVNELHQLNVWFRELKSQFKHIIFVPGNHDLIFDEYPEMARNILNQATVLINESVTIDGITFFGSPLQPEFCNWAFNRSNFELESFWKQAPSQVEVLITHCPPEGILDSVGLLSVGCPALRKYVDRVNPKLHVFGHIHDSHGVEVVNSTTFANSAILNDRYKLSFYPLIFELKDGKVIREEEI